VGTIEAERRIHPAAAGVESAGRLDRHTSRRFVP